MDLNRRKCKGFTHEYVYILVYPRVFFLKRQGLLNRHLKCDGFRIQESDMSINEMEVIRGTIEVQINGITCTSE